MATTTENLGLTKPDAAEGYDIGVFNANADKIDGAFAALANNSKLDTLLDNVAAVKTDTEALVQALATANQNIATLLSNHGSVKAIVRGKLTTSGTNEITIPDTMNIDKVVALFDVRPQTASASTGTSWELVGRTYIITASAGTLTYQLIEFY